MCNFISEDKPGPGDVLSPKGVIDTEEEHVQLDPIFEQVFGHFFDLTRFNNTIFVEVDINPVNTEQAPYTPEQSDSNYLTFRFVLTKTKENDKWILRRVDHINNNTKKLTAVVWCANDSDHLVVSSETLQALKQKVSLYIEKQLTDISGSTLVRDTTRWLIGALLLTSVGCGLDHKYPKQVQWISSQIAAMLHPAPSLAPMRK